MIADDAEGGEDNFSAVILFAIENSISYRFSSDAMKSIKPSAHTHT